MNQTLLDATRRVETMVGRERELEQIRQAIYTDTTDTRCHILLVKGPGGIGKSRLLEEVQWRAGHPKIREDAFHQSIQQQRSREDWTTLGNVVISDVIDLIDIRLSARTKFLEELRNAISWQEGFDFSDYEDALRQFRRGVEDNISFSNLRKLTEKVEIEFWNAYKSYAGQRRIVLIFDTAERLVLRSSEWLLDRGLLHDDELEKLSSQQWLLHRIKTGSFENTTIIVAGREKEDDGWRLFNQVRDAAHRSLTPCVLSEIELGPLNIEEMVVYFGYAAGEWESRSKTSVKNIDSHIEEYRRYSQAMYDLVADRDALNALFTVTAGRPVLLSLYGDLIFEPDPMPAFLQLTNKQLDEQMQQYGQKYLQSSIEKSFIALFFQKPGLRSEIMQALARCPAGLDADQLHFVIDNIDDVGFKQWKPNPLRVSAMEVQLAEIRRLSITRPRPDGRLGLQDEIYRIYAQGMFASRELRASERVARQRLYERLSKWAEGQLEHLKDERRRYQQEDEKRLVLAIHSPTIAIQPFLPSITPSEQDARSQIQRKIRDWELEQLHYNLLRNPNHGLNDDYTDLAEQMWRTTDEEADFVVQQEMWRVLYDDYALGFTNLDESNIKVLRRAAHDEDPARWIKRFVQRRQYQRAISFWQNVEDSILQDKPEAQRTWQHSLNAGERMIWKSYAQIMIGGMDLPQIVSELKATLKTLRLLASAGQSEPVGPKRETGFKGHPALPRLHRVIAVGYNFAGYGRVVLGEYGKAVGNYGRALLYMRETKFLAQQAATRNNLARALASLGRDERGYRVCTDALALRRELGAEIPIAYSLNTLALIGNGMQQLPTAWKEAAQAAAIFKRAGENRGFGLALIQLGIGLRRLANSQKTNLVREATPEELYVLAQRALGEAIEIFKNDPEVLRLAEARLEFGCVLRDQMRLESVKANPVRSARLHRDAEIELERAIHLSREHGFKHRALQAEVDLAWAHFYAGYIDQAEAEAIRVRLENQKNETIKPDYLIGPKHIPRSPIDAPYVFYQLAKLEGLFAAVAIQRFYKQREQIRLKSLPLAAVDDSFVATKASETYKVKLEKDKHAIEQIGKSAESYVLSLIYGSLYSPRSRSLVITYDQIYEHLRRFNAVEYRMFYRAAQSAQDNYIYSGEKSRESTNADIGVSLYNFGNLTGWMDDCFGPMEERRLSDD